MSKKNDEKPTVMPIVKIREEADFLHLKFEHLSLLAVLSGIGTGEASQYNKHIGVLNGAKNAIEKGKLQEAKNLYSEFIKYTETDEEMLKQQRKIDRKIKTGYTDNDLENPRWYAEQADNINKMIGELLNE